MAKLDEISLASARAAWLDDCRFRQLRPDTLREYGRVSARALAFIDAELAGEPRLCDLQPAAIRRWLTEREPPLRPAATAAYVRALRAFSRWCAREYGLPIEPLASLRPPRVEPPSIAVFTPQQLRTLLDGAPLHVAYLITLLAESGLRISEAVALDLEDLDAVWIAVRRGKGGRPRVVPVSVILRRATEHYLAAVRPAMARPPTAALLVNRYGRRWTTDAVRQALRRLAAATAISGVRVSPHTFRHQFARDVAFSGGSLIALRDVLGHRSLAMVERYAVPDDAARLALLPARTPLERVLRGSPAARKTRVSGDDEA